MDDKLDKALRDGRMATELLEMLAFQNAVESVKAAIHERWATSPLKDHEGQHELRLMLKLLEDLLGNLQVAVDNGKMAANELEIQRSMVQTAKRALTNLR